MMLCDHITASFKIMTERDHRDFEINNLTWHTMKLRK